MKGCPYHRGNNFCNAAFPIDSFAGNLKFCTSEDWANCPYYHSLCRKAELAAAKVYAEVAKEQYLDALAGVTV